MSGTARLYLQCSASLPALIFLTTAIMTGVGWKLSVLLVSISLVVKDVSHLAYIYYLLILLHKMDGSIVIKCSVMFLSTRTEKNVLEKLHSGISLVLLAVNSTLTNQCIEKQSSLNRNAH